MGLVLCLLCALVPCSAHAATVTGQWHKVFQIGTFDRSSYGFAAGQPSRPVTYVAGQSNPAKDWFAFEPAVLAKESSSTGPAQASEWRSIIFQVNTPRRKTYKLQISVLIESACVPHLVAKINGREGEFYLQPKLDYSNGDQSDSFFPADSYADVVFEFPGRWLHPGKNTLSLGVVNSAKEEVPGAGITYDAVELSDNRAVRLAGDSSARVEPTIYYERINGDLDEVVNVFIEHRKALSEGSLVALYIGGARYEKQIDSDETFGTDRVQFLVRNFPAHTRAVVAWTSGGHRKRDVVYASPKKKWTLYLVPHIHLDLGYSDYLGKVAAIQAHAIDEALNFITQNPKFRFSVDGEWSLRQFMKTRSKTQVNRAIQAMQQDKFFVPADYANLLTGFPSAEVLIRSLYPSAAISRKYHTPFNYASITDVPSYSWSYASILASAGIHYLVGGSNNYRAPVLLQGRLNEDSPVWWQGPDGQKVLLWYSRIYQQMEMLFGLPPVISAGRQTLPLFLQMYEHPTYPAHAVILYGTQQENTDLFPQQVALAANWNKLYAYPHMKYSGFYNALHSIKEQFGNDIPTIKGSGGPYWEDGIASDAYYAAIERRTEGSALTAQELSTLTAINNPHLKPDNLDLNRMWRDMILMDEHTFDSYNSVSSPSSNEAVVQLKRKNGYAVDAAQLSSLIAKQSFATLAESIPVAPGSLIVFNSLNWVRNGLVSIDLDDGDRIMNESNQTTVPIEVIGQGKGFRKVQFLAKRIPAVGYKVYAIASASGKTEAMINGKHPATSSSADQLVLNSQFYRVTLDPSTGSVKSIFDKQLNREIVNQQSPYRFGQYLYVTGGDHAPNTLLQYSHVYPKPKLDVHGAEGGRLISVAHTPYAEVATLISHDTNTPWIRTKITLFKYKKEIEFTESLVKKKVYSKEAVYFAFPFDMNHPTFRYEIQDGVVNPAKDMYPGAGHEWFSVQHWVAVQGSGMAGVVMPLDTSLVTLGDINRGQWSKSFKNRRGTIFSYVMNNYWDTNYAAGQGGHFKFHYIITSAPTINSVQLSRLGWDEATPMLADSVTTQDKAIRAVARNGKFVYPSSHAEIKVLGIAHPLSALKESFLGVSDPDVVLLAWKGASDGNGTILQFLNMADTSDRVTVKDPLTRVNGVWETDAVERNERALPIVAPHRFEFEIKPHQIVTLRVVGVRTPSA